MKKTWSMKRDKKADIGIGTMIVFIAMVLVAAVAAAVLISTANQVREQATTTGTQAINGVSAGFNKVGVVGYIAADNKLASLNITLRLAAGSPNIYMTNVVVKVVYLDNDKTLTFSSVTPTTWSTKFYGDLSYEAQSGFDADFTVKDGDLLNIQVGGIGGTAWDLNIGNLQNVEVQIIPGFGQPTLIQVNTPEVFLATYTTL